MKNSLAPVINKTKINVIVLCAAIPFFLANCSDKREKRRYTNLDKYHRFIFRNEIKVNDSCIYLLHPYGSVGHNTIIELNLYKEGLNTLLREFDGYSLNGNDLQIKRDYYFHLKNTDLPPVECLDKPNPKLVYQYERIDSILFFDYTFYLPKEDKLCWVNTYDGINSCERLVLSWIKKRITRISIIENINYRVLEEHKKSFLDISVDSLKRSYIIPRYELSDLPPWFDKHNFY
jgi:hypothetical protein